MVLAAALNATGLPNNQPEGAVYRTASRPLAMSWACPLLPHQLEEMDTSIKGCFFSRNTK